MKRELLLIVVVIFIVFGLGLFLTEPSAYIIENPTQDQVLQITQGDPQGRIWFQDANLMYQGSAIIKVIVRVRWYEKDKANDFLNDIGVKYQKVEN